MNKNLIVIFSIVTALFLFGLLALKSCSEDSVQNKQLYQIQSQNKALEKKIDDDRKLEEKKNVQAEIQKQKEDFRKSWREVLIISHIDFHADKFLGGISKASMKITNLSKFKFDDIRLEVLYKKRNDKVIERKYMDAGSVAPGESKIVRLPESKRGVDIEVHFDKVTCIENELNYTKK